MNDQIRYSLAGFCMGIAELIPGISGATVAVIFKIYPNLISILSKLRINNLSFNFLALSKTFQFKVSLPLIFSMLAAIILCSNLINFLISNYETTFLFFLGWLMIFLSIYTADFFKALFQRPKLMLFLFAGILIGLGLQKLSFGSGEITTMYLFIAGLVAFSFFLIPGISGSAMLVVLGVYAPVIQGIANLNFNLLIPFACGCLFSLLILPKLILNLYSKNEQNLTYVFSGLIFSSGFLLL